MALLQITSVRGLTSADGKLESVVVDGTATECGRVTVTLRCRGEEHQRDASVSHDTFSATFTPSEVSAAECGCGKDITVTAQCREDPGRSDTWSGSLQCESEGSTPTPLHACTDQPEPLVDCGTPGPLAGPQYTLPYHRAMPFDPQVVDLKAGDPDTPPPRLGGTRVEDLDVSLAIDLDFQQDWYFQTLGLSDVVSTIALAPGEQLRISIKKTQRKLFEQSTLDSVEKLDSSESTIIDKDVINVARSTSETENWKVDGNGGLRLGAFNLGVSAGYSKSITNTANTSLQRIAESTTKSARSLKSLQKIEVREQLEETGEQVSARTLCNPYRDRSLTVKVFSLAKKYCVETRLASAQPAILVTLKALAFDRDFVLSSGAFLAEHLLDPDLKLELPAALEAVSDFREADNEERAVAMASSSLLYLFESPPDIFGVTGPSAEANRPETSLIVSSAMGGKSGLQDAVDNGYPLLWTTLSFYYQVYCDYKNKLPRIAQDPRLPLELALSLEQTLGPVWSATTEKTLENRGHLTDMDDSTECFRRLAGFLSMVTGVIRPLVQYAEKEEEMRTAARRADLVIDRTIRHLASNSDYYTERFLQYVGATTALRTVKQFVRVALSRLVGNAALQGSYDDVFDLEEAYLHGNQVIVPLRQGRSQADVVPLSPRLAHEEVTEVTLGIANTTEVVLPFDGIHFEATAGACVLADVPPEQRSLTVGGELAVHTGP